MRHSFRAPAGRSNPPGRSRLATCRVLPRLSPRPSAPGRPTTRTSALSPRVPLPHVRTFVAKAWSPSPHSPTYKQAQVPLCVRELLCRMPWQRHRRTSPSTHSHSRVIPLASPLSRTTSSFHHHPLSCFTSSLDGIRAVAVAASPPAVARVSSAPDNSSNRSTVSFYSTPGGDTTESGDLRRRRAAPMLSGVQIEIFVGSLV